MIIRSRDINLQVRKRNRAIASAGPNIQDTGSLEQSLMACKEVGHQQTRRQPDAGVIAKRVLALDYRLDSEGGSGHRVAGLLRENKPYRRCRGDHEWIALHRRQSTAARPQHFGSGHLEAQASEYSQTAVVSNSGSRATEGSRATAHSQAHQNPSHSIPISIRYAHAHRRRNRLART